jgi:hypothetical protein
MGNGEWGMGNKSVLSFFQKSNMSLKEPYLFQYAWVKAKTLYQIQIFNVDAKRLAAG